MGTLGLLWAFAGGVASVHLLIWLQDSRLGLRRAPSLLATAVFALAVFTIAHEGCQNVGAQPVTGRRVLATSFTHMTGPNARWNGSGFACWKTPAGQWVPWGTKGAHYVKLNGNERCVAHRRLRCGTLIEVTYRSQARHGGDSKLRRVLLPRCDAGPYWAQPASCSPRYSARCWRLGRAQVRLKKGYRHINELDITRLSAKDLKFPGMGFVRYRVVRRALRVLAR